MSSTSGSSASSKSTGGDEMAAKTIEFSELIKKLGVAREEAAVTGDQSKVEELKKKLEANQKEVIELMKMTGPGTSKFGGSGQQSSGNAEWMGKMMAQLEVFNSAEFLEMAEKYMKESHPDLTEVSEKLCLAAFSAANALCMKAHIFLASKRAFDMFTKLAITKAERRIGPVANRLLASLKVIDVLFSYASLQVRPCDPEEYKKKELFVRYFVDNFAQTDMPLVDRHNSVYAIFARDKKLLRKSVRKVLIRDGKLANLTVYS